MYSTPTGPPIKRLYIDAGVPVMSGVGIGLQWEISPEFRHRELSFDILFGHHPTDTFSKIATVEGVDQYLDTERRVFHDTMSTWYAIKTTDTVTGEFWFSPPQHAGAVWRKREWLIAREIVRQEQVRLERVRAGTRGYLLRRKSFGEECPVCVSPETHQVQDPSCPTCFGTGIVGGYYPASEVWLELQPERLLRRLDPDQGQLTHAVSSARVLAYPPVNPNDYWVSAKSNRRYRVQEGVTKLAQIDEEPLVLGFDVQIEHMNHIIYQVPVEGL